MDKPIDHAYSFCNHYFYHPLWSAFPNSWMRFSLLPSDYLLNRVKASGISASEAGIGPQEVVFEYANASSGTAGVKQRTSFEKNLKEVLKLNWSGYNLYYFCNQVDPNLGPAKDGQGFCTNSGIIGRLFIPLDYDFPIGVEVGELEDELGLRFSAVVSTSPGRLQCLIPVDWARSMEGDPTIGGELVGALQAACAADVMADGKRLLRLPGSRNWKYVTGKKGEDPETGKVKKSIDVPIAKIVRCEESYEVYGREEIEAACEKARGSSLFREIGDVRGMRSAKGGRGASREDPYGRQVVYAEAGLPEDFPAWMPALEKIGKAERLYPDGCGFRHNALRTWSAQMCYAGLDWCQVAENLYGLAAGAFDSDYREERDFRALLGTSERFWKRVAEEKEREDRWLSEGGDGAGDGGSYENTGMGDGVDSGDASGGADQQVSHGGTDTGRAASDTTGSGLGDKKAAKKLAIAFEDARGWTPLEFVRELGKRLPTEEEEGYIRWLAQVVLLSAQSKSKDAGSFAPLAEKLLSRLILVGAVRDQTLGLPSFDGGFMGLELLGADQTKAFLQQFVCEIGASVNSAGPKLRELAVIVAKGPRFVCKMSTKGDGLASVVSLMLGRAMLTRGGASQSSDLVVFQNGQFVAGEMSGKRAESATDMHSGDFADDSSKHWYQQSRWKMSNAIHAFYRPENFLNGHAVDDKLALMPKFAAYLEDTFVGEGDFKTRTDLVFRIIGYCLVRGNPFQKFFGFIGATGAGKGVLAEIIAGIAGEHNTARINYSSLADPWGFGPLEEKLVCIADEAENADRRVHENCMSGVKRYSGSSRFALRNMREDERVVDATAKIIILCNKDLSVSDSHGALARRLVCLYFGNPCEPGKQRHNLAQEIVDEEGDLIATWAAIKLAQCWPLGMDMFNVKGSASLDRGREEVSAMINPIRVVLGYMVKPKNGIDCGSYVINELIQLLIKSEKIARPSGQLEKVIKQNMASLGFEYRRTRNGRSYANCTISAAGVRQAFDEPDSLIISRFSGDAQSQIRDILESSPIDLG